MNDYDKDIERLKSEQETLKAQVEAELGKLKKGTIQYETVSIINFVFLVHTVN